MTKVTEPDGAFVVFTYDGAHRLTDLTDALGNSVHYTLNNAGQRIQEDTKNASAVVKRTLSRVYDTLGQLQTVADAQATPTDFTYDLNGNLNTATDPLLRVTDNDVDALGRLKQVIANVNGGTSDKAISEFQYDARDNVRAVIDPKGLSTNYTYDSLGNLTELASPDTGSSIYTYDLAGNRTAEMKADNVTQGYVYDALGRLTSKTFTTSSQNISYIYDVSQSDCLAGETFGVGRLTKAFNNNVSTRFCYDSRGNRIRTVQAMTPGATLTTGVTYDAADRVKAISYPGGTNGAVVTYYRNGNGKIERVDVKPNSSAPLVTLVSAVAYLPFGPLGSMTFGNGRVLTKAYDQNYGIDSVTDSAASNPLSQDFALDAAGNITGLAERTNGTTVLARTFTYDGLDRLTAQKNGASTVEGFTYDPTGNRLSKTAGTTTSYSYPAGSHRLSAVGATNRTYKASGETTVIGTLSSGKSFVYNLDHRLLTSKVNNVAVGQYYYDAFGQRTGKALSPTMNSRQFVYDVDGRLLGEYTQAGVPVKQYVWLDDTLVGIVSSFDGSTYQFVETDHLGTPRAVIHPSKNVIVWRWDLNPSAFGEHAPAGNPDGDALTYELNLRFPGQYYDSESGMHYNYFRDYDPSTGRYLESDPIGLEGGVSTYGYVRANPGGLSDPTGLFAPPPPPVALPLLASPAGLVGGAFVVGYGTGLLLNEGIEASGLGNSVRKLCSSADENNNNSDDCKRILREIAELMGKLNGRFSDMLEDKLNLYELAPTGTNSWEGHAHQIHGLQNAPRRAIQEAIRKRCTVPNGAWKLAWRGTPNMPRGR